MAIQVVPPVLQGISRLLPLLTGGVYSASETDPEAIEYLMKLATSPVVSALRDTPSGTFSAPDLDEIEIEQERMRELNKRITLPSDALSKILITPESEGLPSLISSPIPPEEKVSVDDIGFTPTPALKLEDMIMTAENPAKKKVFSKEKLDTVFDNLENLYEEDYQGFGPAKNMMDTIRGDYGINMPFYEYFEDRYHGGVGDLGDSSAAKAIAGYGSDYEIYRDLLQKYFKDNLGDEFVGYRLMNSEDALEFLSSNTSAATSFSLRPREARAFAFYAISDAFMDPITMGPRDDLVLVEAPIKADSLIMRGKGSEKEVVINPSKSYDVGTDIRLYNPYTGELIKDAESGSLKGTSLLNIGGEDFPKIDLSRYVMDEEKVNLSDNQISKLKEFNNIEFNNVSAETITVTDKEIKGRENFPRFVYTSDEDTSALRSGDWASQGDVYGGTKVKKIDLSKLDPNKITFEKEGILYDEVIPEEAIKKN